MSSKNIVLVLKLLIVVVAVFIILSFVTLLFLIYHFVTNSPETLTGKSYPHKYQLYNPETNKTTYGMVKINRILRRWPDNTERIRYRMDDGKYVLITPFWDIETEYVCTGTCICEGYKGGNPELDEAMEFEDDEYEDNRRIAPATYKKWAKKIIWFTVSTVVATVAINYALEYFGDECILRFAMWCNGIDYKGTKCERKGRKLGTVSTSDIRKKRERVDYFCEGACRKNTKLDLDELSHGEDEPYDCETYELHEPESYPKGATLDTIKYMYRQRLLEPFCKAVSEVEIEEIDQDEDTKMVSPVKYKRYICEAVDASEIKCSPGIGDDIGDGGDVADGGIGGIEP